MVEIDKGGIGPEAPLDIFTRNYLPGSFDQEQKDAEGLRLEFDENAGFPQFTRCWVQLKAIKTDFRLHRHEGATWTLCTHRCASRIIDVILTTDFSFRHWYRQSTV